MWKFRYMWKVAKCEKNSMLNVNIDAIYEQITLNVKKLDTLFWRYLWKSNFNAFLISERYKYIPSSSTNWKDLPGFRIPVHAMHLYVNLDIHVQCTI